MDADPQLPMAGAVRRERGDAAANRARILNAARELLDRHGPDGLTMDAVAATAGVGKGTVFRRFGDRAGLTAALIDESTRDFQERFLHGPPPLGPGAPASDRLDAFFTAFIDHLASDPVTAQLADELREHDVGAYGVLVAHVAHLVAQVDRGVDPQVTAEVLLAATGPLVIGDVRSGPELDPAEIRRSVQALLRGLGR